jgi:hypothetical protein
MAKRDLPDLTATGRRYRDDTLRVRLQSPGIERFEPRERGFGRTLAIALVLAAGLAGVLAYLAGS